MGGETETLNQLWARAIVEELVRGGVQHAVICPGSRSTPLALAFAEQGQDRVQTWSVIDERSAAFVALGIGKATGRPAAVLATSGTAGANFYPAVIEAGMSRVPMVVLTADRPPELQGWGAPQTIDQRALFGAHARWWLDAGVPELATPAVVHLRAQVARAVAVASRPPRGAVHLNVPFREPLAPQPDAPPLGPLSPLAARGREGDAPYTRIAGPADQPSAEVVKPLADRLRRTEKGIIVCGPRDAQDGLADAVRDLGKAYGYPVLAEAASNVRYRDRKDEVLCLYDAVLRCARFADAHAPEVVLRFGGGLTPSAPQAWLDRSGAFTVQFSDEGALVDPQHSASLVIEGDPVAACRALIAAAPAERRVDWRRRFEAAERCAWAVLEIAFEEDGRLTEPRIAREVLAALPAEATLFLSSSMPIRDVDAFAHHAEGTIRVLANRGANGIDGVISSALGASIALQRPTVLLAGDLAFLHDLGGLVTAARHELSLVVVVVNNGGGGIFSFLPVAGRTPHFEALFGTPHGLDLAHAAALFGATYHRPADPAALRAAVRDAWMDGGLHVIDAQVPDRAGNVLEHRALFARVAEALEREGP
jgi:2-succinyl-5-enolpyruvyl-6-hydroxy-3-cyclohexene-1-carboxylate synthase